ncbi:hypothetical protein SLEP1_g49283 [Rubroshorea leprosula]|uniref:Disease resistance RPP13-like protein 1 n=1 Tax=Rubroshorea leprosula TaxID=152421 RepID=A0AAV5LWL5_9ROSI|nr:hypothetical protein SLEP1_g49283 [Rubroshorea leprosula]
MNVLSIVGDSLLSTTFDLLFQKLNEYLSDHLWDSKEEACAQMESWKTLLPKIIAVLQHAEENQVANQFVKSYLDDLRDLAYDMEDILEEFVIDAKRSKLIAKSKARSSKRQRITSIVKNFFSSNKAKPNQEINSMVKDLSARLQKIHNGMCSLELTNLALKLEDMSHKVATKRLLESSLLEDKVWGRDRDKDAIIQRLLEDGGSLEQDFVIPIVGMGGLGKTTLARLIYNDKRLEGMFDLKLQEKLKGKLSRRKFFLVLDDVWNKEYGKWDVLKRPFMSGALGSKIIVTTRNKDVGMMMRGDDGIYNLELLQDDVCLPLFTQHALGKENFDMHPDLQDIGEKLVTRCKRLPLALKTLGGVLRGKLHYKEWENILNSEIWSPLEDRSGILPTLRLSYNHLPSHLKRCFAYCALFPKDYEFEKKELVLLWMAEGLLQQQSHGKKQMEEEIGHQYFQELLSRSLFQRSSRVESQFVMHDLINDLAVDVAGEIYCNLERSMGDEKLKKARHLSFTPHSYEISERFTVLDKLKHLRTFLPLPTTIGNLIDLHYLDINETPSLKEMPAEICNLKNLVTLSKVIVGKASGLMRLFDLKNFSQLRGRLSLLDLQNVLDVQDAREANLDKIHGLEELLLGWTTFDNDRNELVPEMQVLHWLKPHPNLKSLEIFCYSGENFPNWVCDPLLFFNLSSMVLSSCRRCTLLPSLGLLPVLKELIIEGMEAIEVVGFEFYGRHDSFSSLEVLRFHNMLNWKEWTSPTGSDGEFPCLCTLVIENCPKLGQLPSNLSSLKKLDVRSCDAMLLMSMSYLTSLANLRIEKISELSCLPGSFTRSLRALETLDITCCNDLTCLWEEGTEIEQSLLPFNLKHLSIVGCAALESLPNAMMMRMDGSSSSNTSMLMSRLEKLEIWGCYSLKSFPRGKLPITLKYLSISNCKVLGSLPDVDGESNSNLHLEITNIPCLYSSEGYHHLLAFLKKLTVYDGGEWLESFSEGMLQHCTGLQSIFIFDCKILKSLPTLDCVNNLVELSIYGCEALESLPHTMCQLKSLQRLEMVECPGIEFIPDGGLPPNLTHLHLRRFKNLKCVPNTMYQLTSLQVLSLPGEALTMGFGQSLQSLTSLQDLAIEQKLPVDIVLPSSLTSLGIYGQENLESIPSGFFRNLNSLKVLKIVLCSKLQSLPREGFPPSLGRITIQRCPFLEQQRFEEKGDYCTLTHTIPCIWMDYGPVIRPSVN